MLTSNDVNGRINVRWQNDGQLFATIKYDASTGLYRVVSNAPDGLTINGLEIGNEIIVDGFQSRGAAETFCHAMAIDLCS